MINKEIELKGIKFSKKNVTIAKDGVEEYDLIVDIFLQPKVIAEYIEIKHTIVKEGIK